MVSSRSSWLRRFTNSFCHPAARVRRGRQSVPVEALEDRKYLSANVMLLDQGHTLRIVGDSGDNHIVVQQTAQGVQVTADAQPTLRFTGIDLIVIETGDGNDNVTVISGFNPQPDPPGAPLSSFELKVQLGTGRDQFLADILYPPDPCLIAVDSGVGDDLVTLNAQLDNNSGGLNFTSELGEGNDRFNGNVAWPSDPPTAEDFAEGAFPPDPCHIAVIGGGGADKINALIGLLSNAAPAGDIHAELSLSLDGGDGNDAVTSTLRNLNLNGGATIDLQGGTGNDIVKQVFDMVAVNAGLDLTADGGRGDDFIGVTAGSATPAAAPSLFVNSPTRLTEAKCQ
ncbi:MAG: hypothetical protein ACKV2Q_35150 [Planctomycetaceae bacterium]